MPTCCPDASRLDACDVEPPADERSRRVLAELGRDGGYGATVAFQGLRRRLGLHQQVLTRTLRRLTRAGLVEDRPDGYALTDAGFACLNRVPEATDGARDAAAMPVVQAILPPHVDGGHVGDALQGRWWRGLRWYARTDAPGEVTLSWLTEPGERLVRLRVHGGSVSVEAEVGDDGTGVAAAGPLLAALADLYGPPGAG